MPRFLRRIGSVFTKSIPKVISQLCGNQEHILTGDLPSPLAAPLPPSAPCCTGRHRRGTRRQSTANTVISNNAINIANRDVHVQNQNYFYFPPAQDRASKEHDIIEWVSGINFRNRHKENVDVRIKDTGTEFLCSHKVRAWINREYRLLLGTGFAGAGKSIMASALVEHIQAVRPCSVGRRFFVAYVFFQSKDDLSVTDILAALIRQTLERWPDLIGLLEDKINSCRQQRTRFTLQQHIEALQDLWERFETVYLIVDGLHEGVNGKIGHRLLSIPELITNVSLFATSRESDPRTLLPHMMCCIRASNSDIRSLVTHELQHLCIDGKIFDIELEDVVKVVCKASNGMFLHAELQIKAMELYHEKEEFSKALQNVPEKLESMYQLILNLVDQQPQPAASRARSALLYIISAQRRLYFDELQYVLATCPNTHQFDPKRMLAEETLLTFCCGLVALDGAPDTRRSVRLFHDSAEPVLRELLKGELLSSHETLASICMASLSATGIQNMLDPGSLVELLASPTTPVCPTTFLRYAYDNWAFHARRASRPDGLKQFLLHCASFPVDGDLLGPLHVAAYYNLLPMEGLTWEGGWETRTTIKSKTALMLAAGEGHAESVAAILATGRRVSVLNATDSANRTALTYASQGGHSKVVEYLLQYRNIKLDVVDEAGKTAITTAETSGHIKVAILLYNAEVRKSNSDLHYGISTPCQGATFAATIPATIHVS